MTGSDTTDVRLLVTAISLLSVGLAESHLTSLLESFSIAISPMSLEALIGIVAITTFLVGFSTVRQQTRLEDYRVRVARLTDRVIDQNNEADMLPLPSGMIENRLSDKFSTSDPITQLTERLSIAAFTASSFMLALQFRQEEFNESIGTFVAFVGVHLGHILVQTIHAGIVILGIKSRITVQRTADEDSSRSSFAAYASLEAAIENWLKCGTRDSLTPEAQQVRDCCDSLDVALPEWAWLHLVRCSLGIEKLGTNQLSNDYSSGQSAQVDFSLAAAQINLDRIFSLARRSQSVDSFSQLAFVWSAYLRDAGGQDNASERIRISDIYSLVEFLQRSIAKQQRTGALFAEMALRDVRWVLSHSKSEIRAPKPWQMVGDTPPIEIVFNDANRILRAAWGRSV